MMMQKVNEQAAWAVLEGNRRWLGEILTSNRKDGIAEI
jgi:hypothetical protein